MSMGIVPDTHTSPKEKSSNKSFTIGFLLISSLLLNNRQGIIFVSSNISPPMKDKIVVEFFWENVSPFFLVYFSGLPSL